MAAEKITYQFKISLNESEPLIWRRIQISETVHFEELHIAIQDAMGWEGCHLHLFCLRGGRGGKTTLIGVPGDDAWEPILPGQATRVNAFFTKKGQTMTYEYDFGDSWEHEVLL